MCVCVSRGKENGTKDSLNFGNSVGFFLFFFLKTLLSFSLGIVVIFTEPWLKYLFSIFCTIHEQLFFLIAKKNRSVFRCGLK